MSAALAVVVLIAFAIVVWGPVNRRLRRDASQAAEGTAPAFAPPVHDREAPIAWTTESAPHPMASSGKPPARPVSRP